MFWKYKLNENIKLDSNVSISEKKLSKSYKN